ncbi:hypothetical protein [Amycolatopsis magusensis]|uniref:hypothetical protein n=1 Tax=Amycolatopsis magusensis TaxID=882444 RepID=UPI0037BD8EAE
MKTASGLVLGLVTGGLLALGGTATATTTAEGPTCSTPGYTCRDGGEYDTYDYCGYVGERMVQFQGALNWSCAELVPGRFRLFLLYYA